MSETNPRVRRYLATGIIYLALVASVFGFNIIRSRTTLATAALSGETPTPASPPQRLCRPFLVHDAAIRRCRPVVRFPYPKILIYSQ